MARSVSKIVGWAVVERVGTHVAKAVGYAAISPPAGSVNVAKAVGYAAISPPAGSVNVAKAVGYAAVTVTAPAPTNCTANEGPPAGGTNVTIAGTGFGSGFGTGATVSFGGTAATNVVVGVAPTLVGTTTASTTGGANVTPALPASIQDGDLLLAWEASRDNAQSTMPAGWTRVYDNTGGGLTRVCLAWARYKASNPNTGQGETNSAPTFTRTSNTAPAVAACSAWRGVVPYPASPLSTIGLGNLGLTTGTAISTPWPITTSEGEVVLHAVGAGTGDALNTMSNLTGCTTEVVAPCGSDASASGRAAMGWWYNASPFGELLGTGPAGATASEVPSSGWRSLQFTIKPAVSGTQITCTTPAHAGGTVDVVVTNPDGQTGTLASGFTYTSPAPTVTGADPSNGPTAGGTSVTLAGTGFVTGATVTFGGTAATNVTVVSGTSITCDTPAHAWGVVDVVVTNPDLQFGTLSNGFTYVAPPPDLTSVLPASGPIAGGTDVTLGGTGFLTGATVSFGGVAATNVVVVSGASITCTTGAHAWGAVDVVVTNPDTQFDTLAAGFTYVAPPPVLTGIVPSAGSLGGGTNVSLTGSDFMAAATVTFGGTAATNVVVVSATSITCTTPAHAFGAADVVVTNPDAQFDTLVQGFAFVTAAPPVISSVSPSSGPTNGGTLVTISGTGFDAGTVVTVGGQSAALVLLSATSIIVNVQPHAAGACDVVVENGDGQVASLVGGYTYTYATPEVILVDPNGGALAGGTAVTVRGSGFRTGATVAFGAVAATNVVVVSAFEVTCTTPAHASGAVDVEVTNTDAARGVLGAGFLYGTPVFLSSVVPARGPLAGGTSVTIGGSGFQAGATVTFGAVAATNVVVVSETEITCTTPSFPAGPPVDVAVTSGGVTATLADAFTFYAYLAIIEVAPASGPPAGGTVVTIRGAGFTGNVTAVTFGGVAATSFEVVSDEQLSAVTPAHAVGAVQVEVELAASIHVLWAGFTYVESPGEIPALSMRKLLLVPDEQGYSFSEAEHALAVQHEGAQANYRADLPNAPAVIDCTWTLDPAEYDVLVAHYLATGAKGLPFLIDLMLDNRVLAEVEAKFVPGSFKLAEHAGETYRVEAQLLAVPPAMSDAAAQAIVDAYSVG